MALKIEATRDKKKKDEDIPKPKAASIYKCPSLVSDVLLSHGLTPQYHRR